MSAKTKLMAVVAMVGALGMGSVALAGPGGPGGGHGPRGGDMAGPYLHALRQLDLTEEQQTQLRSLREANREAHQAEREEMKSVMESFRTELLSDSPRTEVLHSLLDQRLELQTAAAHERIDDLLAARAVLTPEQRVELAEILENPPERSERGRRGQGRGERSSDDAK